MNYIATGHSVFWISCSIYNSCAGLLEEKVFILLFCQEIGRLSFPTSRPPQLPLLIRLLLQDFFLFLDLFKPVKKNAALSVKQICFHTRLVAMPYNLDLIKATWKSSTGNKNSVTIIKFGKMAKIKGFYC